MSQLILVTGASGNVGSHVAKLLDNEGLPIRLLARRPEKLSAFPHADLIQGDYSDIASLDHAFSGVSAAFVVSGYAAPHSRAAQHRNVFEAAQRAGVGYLIYLSFLGASPDSHFPMSRDHYESEQYLKSTKIPCAILRDSFYTELALEMFDPNGVLKGPAGNGKVSWVGRQEVAEAVAQLLRSSTPRLGTFALTGPQALSLGETAAMLFDYRKESSI